MNAKNFLSIGLLLFLAIAVVTTIVRESGKETQPSPADAALADAALPQNGLVAYYFHGEVRCPTCRNIEAYAHEAMESGFAEELASGQVEWRVVNYETPANAHFTNDYEIVFPTIVLVRTIDGHSIEWHNLTRTWELVGDKEAFIEYVQLETKELLKVSKS